jgi:hypothetical protein
MSENQRFFHWENFNFWLWEYSPLDVVSISYDSSDSIFIYYAIFEYVHTLTTSIFSRLNQANLCPICKHDKDNINTLVGNCFRTFSRKVNKSNSHYSLFCKHVCIWSNENKSGWNAPILMFHIPQNFLRIKLDTF